MKSFAVLMATVAISAVSSHSSELKRPELKRPKGSHPISHLAKKATSRSSKKRAATAKPVTKPAARSHRAVLRKAAPQVSAAVREAALVRVSARLMPMASRFENPEALQPFFDRMRASRTTGEPVHILQFGDSHTASDDWVDSMRQYLQAKYGNGGPGFGMAGRPFRGYRRFDMRGNSSTGWETEGTVSHPGDGEAGLSGISITSHRAGESVWADASTEAMELFYLKQPGGGTFVVDVDGMPVQTVETDGPAATGVFRHQPLPGEHIYAVRTLTAGPVRLYGWVAENRSGVTWETLGINGAQASMILNWNESLWTEQIVERDPALVVLAYGTNEANSPSFDRTAYASGLRDLIARIQRAVPRAAIVMVGPPDCGARQALLHLDEVQEIERTVAAESGVAFWDWRNQMGGNRSTVEWVRAGLGQADHIHLTGSGYRLLGQALAADLDADFQNSTPVAAPDAGQESRDQAHD